jgi:hypothetical protein
MTNEERDLIARFIARVGGAPQSGGFLTGGSVPSSQPALPPIDRDADAFIGQQFQQFPEARYRITQTAVVTEAALAEAQNRIKRLEWELEQTKAAAEQAVQQAQQAAQQGAAQASQQRSGGFFSTMFGGGQQQARPGYAPQQQGQPMMGQPMMGQPAWGGYQPTTPPPQPQYAPGYQPGMFQRGGSGFLGSALTTAAGVAGGMVVGNALMNAFEGHRGSSEASLGGGFGGGTGGGSPWGTNTSDTSGSIFDNAGVVPTDPTAGFGTNTSDPFAGGGDIKQDAGGFDTQSGWNQGGGFDDAGSADTGGFDGGGGGFDDNNT